MARHTHARIIILAPQDWWDDPDKLRPLYHPQELHTITCAQVAHTYNSLPMASGRPRNHPKRQFTVVCRQHTAMPHLDWGLITNHVGHAVFRWGMRMVYPEQQPADTCTPTASSKNIFWRVWNEECARRRVLHGQRGSWPEVVKSMSRSSKRRVGSLPSAVGEGNCIHDLVRRTTHAGEHRNMDIRSVSPQMRPQVFGTGRRKVRAQKCG